MATSSANGLSYVKYSSNGSDTEYQFDFQYLSENHIKVYTDGVLTNDYTNLSGQIIKFNEAVSIGKTIFIKRETPSVEPMAYFVNQSSLNKEDLNKTNTQVLYVMQEILDEVNQRLPTGSGDNEILNNLNMNGFKIVDLGQATEPEDAITLGQVRDIFSSLSAGNVVIEEEITATKGQTVFNLSKIEYTPGYLTITVFIDGIAQAQSDIIESGKNQITFTEPCNGKERVVVRKNDSPTSSITIKQADYDVLGAVMLSTDAEAAEGTNRLKAITPAALKYVLQRFLPQDASTTQKGVVQLAERTELNGEDKASTPDNVKYIAESTVNSKMIISTGSPNNSQVYANNTLWFQIEP